MNPNIFLPGTGLISCTDNCLLTSMYIPLDLLDEEEDNIYYCNDKNYYDDDYCDMKLMMIMINMREI